MIHEIAEITDEIYAMAGTTNSLIATGGMKTKIQAAQKAVENGIETYILNGTNDQVFEKIIAGKNPGTHFLANQEVSKAKKHWLKHTLKSHGQLLLDSGAVKAVKNNGASLLPSGILSITGEFLAGESLDIIDASTKAIVAKGICQYNHQDLSRIKREKTDRIQSILGFCPSKVIVHRDDMVII
jgi:glutamate 5-kinase